MNHPELREKDITVLQAIHDGATTVTDIRQQTTLTTRQINYSINEKSLQQMGLVNVNREEGRNWQTFDGNNKNIWNPKQLQLTDQAIQLLTELNTDNNTRYEDMSRQELIQRIHELENRQDRLETMFKDFRNKVMEKF